MIKRNIGKNIEDILKKHKKMIFISGPRQAGKTTLAKNLLKTFGQGIYFNWDIIKDQKKLLNDPSFFEKLNRIPSKKSLIVFDEIHKYAQWKNYLKGVYDGYGDEFLFIATGSGRLNLFKKGGDSLLGRYFSMQLFPLSMGEIIGTAPNWNAFKKKLAMPFGNGNSRKIYDQLLKYSGFPEPFTKHNDEFYNMWFQERKTLLIREDIRNAYAIREISNIESLSNILPEKIGSPLSINSMREDIKASFDSIKSWLLILEQFYYLFKIRPFSKSIARALKKEAKIYLYDWAEVNNEASRFENIIAFHLYKAVNLWRSLGQADTNLSYIRDKEKREVDFLITEKGRPFLLIECKLNDETLSSNLASFQNKLKIPIAIQLVNKKNICKKLKQNGFTQWILSADKFLEILP
ncbi:MAG: ATP-binding protein [Elusimicrobiota bacterium]|nr:ATP-binding protein [Elusimicrobiota bacterium]